MFSQVCAWPGGHSQLWGAGEGGGTVRGDPESCQVLEESALHQEQNSLFLISKYTQHPTSIKKTASFALFDYPVTFEHHTSLFLFANLPPKLDYLLTQSTTTVIVTVPEGRNSFECCCFVWPVTHHTTACFCISQEPHCVRAVCLYGTLQLTLALCTQLVFLFICFGGGPQKGVLSLLPRYIYCGSIFTPTEGTTVKKKKTLWDYHPQFF